MKKEKKTVLVIEDEEAMAHILEDRLELEGFAVEVARDGKAGIERALAMHPDLIVLDIVLPKMNGAEVLQELIGDTWGKTVAIVCLTNLMTVPDSIQKVMKTHDTIDYIVKVNTRLDAIIEHVKARLEK